MSQIGLSRGLSAIVDDQDYERIAAWRWFAMKGRRTFYAVRTERGADGSMATHYMHREIMNAEPGDQVDHVNHEGLDNRRINLRLCDNGSNQANRKPLTGKMYCEFKGVTLHKRTGNWTAQVTDHGKVVNLGTYSSAEDAARAYDRCAVLAHGDFALTNEMLGLLPEDHGGEIAKRRLQSNNTSGFTGVRWHKASGLWQARIWSRGETVWAAYFVDVREAGLARAEKMRELGIRPHISPEDPWLPK